MWEFAANHPGWFFAYMLVVVPFSAFFILFLFVLLGGGSVKVSRGQSTGEEFDSHPHNTKVVSGEGKTLNNAGTTRH